MRVCIPTNENSGNDSTVCEHFGSAPWFLVADTGTGETTAIANRDPHHAHGTCHPIGQLAGHAVEAVVAGGIGHRALQGLRAAGLTVFMPGAARTVGEILAACAAGTLAELTEVHACGGLGHGRGASGGGGRGRGGRSGRAGGRQSG